MTSLHLALAVALTITSSCTKVPAEYRDFFDLPADKRQEALHRYSLEQRVDLLVLSMTVRRPISFDVADAVAESGKDIVPLMIERLRTARDEAEVSALLYGLLKIDQRVYEWRKAPELRAKFVQVVAATTDPARKARLEALLN